jgi:hypothetical protein
MYGSPNETAQYHALGLELKSLWPICLFTETEVCVLILYVCNMQALTWRNKC